MIFNGSLILVASIVSVVLGIMIGRYWGRRGSFHRQVDGEDQTELVAYSLPHVHTLTYVNEAYCRYFGKTSEELLGTSFLDHIPEPERESVDQTIAQLSADKPVVYMEHWIELSDGDIRSHRWSDRAVFDDTGKIVEIRGVGRDITETQRVEQTLRDSEEQYRLLVESSPDAVLVARADRQILFANSAAIELFRADRPDQIIGLNVLDLVLPADRDEVDGFIAEILQGKRLPFAERRRVRLDGTEFDSESRGVPFTWDRSAAILIITRDITERKQSEAQLRQSQKMEAVGQLTGGVAHDFNNLLAIILGNAELLKERVDEHDLTDPVIRAATRGADLTQKLLAFSHKQPLWPKVLRLNDVIDSMTGILRRTLSEAIEIKTVTTADLWEVEADESQLENLLLNLAINARNAMLNGGVLTIETANISIDEEQAVELDVSSGDYATLTVSDTGSGMSASVLEHAFEPFFTTKEVGEGSGLGLSMAYGFAKQSGGLLVIKSQVGHGTTVTLYLPKASQSQARNVGVNTDARQLEARGETILVVEDEPDMRQIAVTLLHDLGYRVLEADMGVAGIETLNAESRIDLLLTDLVLPGGMSGTELALAGKESHPELKILLMSGYGAEDVPTDIHYNDNVEFLKKPFSRDHLARMVRDALDGKRRGI